MKLAAISGVNGVYSDEDIARVRELALQARAAQAAKAGRKSAAAKQPARKRVSPEAKPAADTATPGLPKPLSARKRTPRPAGQAVG